jgi:hypothetical protein
VIGAARLDVRTYEEIEADPGATTQALAVVLLSSIAAGAGRGGEDSTLGLIVLALMSWIIWAGLSYLIGAYLIPEPQTQANMGQMLRTIGFADAPGILRFLGLIPTVERLIYPIVSVWLLVALVIAIRQGLDYKSTLRAVAVCLLGAFVSIAFVVVFGAMFLISARSILF